MALDALLQDWFIVSARPKFGDMTFALRMLFDIPGGLGFILNMDESMSYRYDEASRVWTYQILIYYFRQFDKKICGKSSK